MAYCIDKITAQGVDVQRIILIGGGARSEAVRRIAPAILGAPVHVPMPAEYVALGAARQAAWTLSQQDSPPSWSLGVTAPYTADPTPQVLEQIQSGAATHAGTVTTVWGNGSSTHSDVVAWPATLDRVIEAGHTTRWGVHPSAARLVAYVNVTNVNMRT